MAPLSVTLAVDRYDRHIPLICGSVGIPGVELVVREVGQARALAYGGQRHERMLINHEFDIAEVSLASYIAARAAGDEELTALPIFPRRLFSASQIWCASDAPFTHPRDLLGKRVGIRASQVTLTVLVRGHLDDLYGIDWKEIEWFTELEDVISQQLGSNKAWGRTLGGESVDQALLKGDVDAFVIPHPPRRVMDAESPFRQLFPNAKAEDESFYRSRGYWPIMHVIAVRRSLLGEHPWLARRIIELFDSLYMWAMDIYNDPSGSVLAWGHGLAMHQARTLGPMPWTSGLQQNAANLRDFLAYASEQGIAANGMKLENLFDDNS